MFRSGARGLYNFGFQILHGATQFNQFGRESEKLAIVLSNPASLKVFALQCDLFSLGKVCVKNDKGEDIEDDPFIDFIENPNPLTGTQAQFLWDFMFYLMLGTDYCYVDSRVLNPSGKRNVMYHLIPGQIEWPREFDTIRDHLIFSEDKLKKLRKQTITYRYANGESFEFPFDRLVTSYDLTNGIGNFFKGPSRLDALIKIISNSEHTLDAENINIRYSGKFLVGGKFDPMKSQIGLGDDEKKDIREKMDSPNITAYPTRGDVQIRRFVENMAALQLDGVYESQYFRIGGMYNIPRDVLEAYNKSSTYENQEKARAAHVNYCLEPKGEQFMDSFEVHFGYKQQKKNITISWKHLPFMQIFAKEEAETKKATIEVLTSLLNMGVPLEQANLYAGTEFEIEEPEPVENGQEEDQAGQGGNQEGDQAEGESDITESDNQEE